jgi:uncharacterized Zn finger protein (UPF0148 family)
MVCRNMCEKIYSKIEVALVGKKYCRRCEIYMYHNGGIFCPCCGMQLRTTPIDKKGKEKIRNIKTKMKWVKIIT